jgi:hypothetical protein
MSDHRARAERLLADLDDTELGTSQALVTVVWALAEATVALGESQDRLVDALARTNGGVQ